MVHIEQRRVRKHGFECPWDIVQILTYILYFGDIVSFYAIDIVCLSHNPLLASALGAVYAVLATFTAAYAVISTKINPEDPTIEQVRMCQRKGVEFDASQMEFYCQVCESHVLAGTKHCGACNRCSSGFDHHCRYLNNCIGKRNYAEFFRLILWVFQMCLLHASVNGFVMLDLVNDTKEVVEAHMKVYQADLTKPFFIVLVFTTVCDILALVFLLNLIAFHIQLQSKGLTTYEFLQLQEQVSRESKVVLRVEKLMAMRRGRTERKQVNRETQRARRRLEL